VLTGHPPSGTQITSPSVNTQKDGEPVPKLDSYSRGMGRFVGNHYIKVSHPGLQQHRLCKHRQPQHQQRW
jgi:hypothetical protein